MGEGGDFVYSDDEGSCNIVLVNPPYDNPVVKEGVHYTSFPLSLAYLSAVLKDDGFSVRGYDLYTDDRGIIELVEEIKSLRPGIIGISVTSLGLRFVRHFINNIRAAHPDVKIVVGGPHITVEPSFVIELNADYGFRGEAETGFRALCRHLLQDRELGSVDGLIDCSNLREDTHPVIKESIDGVPSNVKTILEHIMPVVIDDIDELPLPDRSLFNEKDYRFQPVIVSRGCPFECCYCGMAGTRFRLRSIDSVITELKDISSRGLDKIDFADDVFTLDREYVRKLCEKIQEEGIKITWSATTRADLLDEELIVSMKSAGLKHISIGVESGVEHVRFGLGKKVSNEQYIKIFRLLKDAGVKARAYAMLGLPGESLNDMVETIRFINSIGPDNVLYTPTIVFPGTRLMHYCLKNKLIDPDIWRKYMLGSMSKPIFHPKGISRQTIEKVVWEGYSSFFLRPQFIKNMIKEASSLGDIVKAGGLAATFVWTRVFNRRDNMSKYVR